MTRKKFNLIVFDWDGTLMDSTAAIVKSIQAAADSLGLPVPDRETAAHVIGLGLYEAMEAVMPGADDAIYRQMADRYRQYYLQFSQEILLFDGVIDMLEDLAASHYMLAVATGKSRRGLDRVLLETGTGHFFHATRTADQTYSKPHPAMLQEITEELGESMRHTVMIGDTTHDLLMASNAGAAGIAVQYGAHPIEELKRLNPLYTAESVTGLHNWLKNNA
ncbi:HAD-IA family hydrolase [Oxalobacter sp. OttesenSCG-928-P03]|nr:HAD-IA family hydrolase [Oxalobacter sp. OttesenSCG-928-P03]